MSMFSNSIPNGHPVDDQTVSSHRQINIIGQGTVVEGTIETDENIRISGTVHGEVISSGRVVVSEAGHIEGDVHAANADVAGKIQGEVHVEERLHIRTSAVIMGNIMTEQLAVEEGGCFTGRCVMNGADIESMAMARDKDRRLEADVPGDEADSRRKEQSAAAA